MKPRKNDPFDHPDWKRYARRFREKVLPDIASSVHVMVLSPEEPDVKVMLEIGAAILLDKPLILLVPPGRTVLPRLQRVADKVIKIDISTEEGQAATKQRLLEYLKQ